MVTKQQPPLNWHFQANKCAYRPSQFYFELDTAGRAHGRIASRMSKASTGEQCTIVSVATFILVRFRYCMFSAYKTVRCVFCRPVHKLSRSNYFQWPLRTLNSWSLWKARTPFQVSCVLFSNLASPLVAQCLTGDSARGLAFYFATPVSPRSRR